jgi:hypothetical protein
MHLNAYKPPPCKLLIGLRVILRLFAFGMYELSSRSPINSLRSHVCIIEPNQSEHSLHFWRFFPPKWNIPPPRKHCVAKLEAGRSMIEA